MFPLADIFHTEHLIEYSHTLQHPSKSINIRQSLGLSRSGARSPSLDLAEIPKII